MAEKTLTLVIRAKNAIGGALAEAHANLKTFSLRARQFVSSVFAPAAIAGTIAAGVIKAVDFIVARMQSAGKVLRSIHAGNAAASLDSLKQSVKQVTAEYALLNKALATSQTAIQDQTRVARELADANTALQKAKRLAALNPDDKEGRKAIEDEYDRAGRVEGAARQIEDIQREQADLAAQANLKTAEALDIDAQIKAAQAQYARAAKAAADYGAKAVKAAKVWIPNKWSADTQKMWMAAAQEQEKYAKGAADLEAELTAKAKTLRREALDASAKAARMDTEIQAAEIAKQAIALENKTQAEIDAAAAAQEAADARIAAEKEANDKLIEERERLLEEYAQAEKDARAKQWEAQKADAEKELALAEELAGKKIAAFIQEGKDNAKADKDAAKEAEREAKRAAMLEDRQRKGGRLSKKQQEWLDAFNAIQGAKGQLQPLRDQIKVAEDNLAQLQQTNRTLAAIQKGLDQNHAALDALLKLG